MSVVVPMSNDEHRAVQALLPWYVRGQLDPADLQQVQHHLLQCEACRRELAAEQPMQSLLAVVGASAPTGDPEAGLARLHARLPEHAPQRPRAPLWMPWALGLQGMALAVVAVLWLQARVEAPGYEALSAPRAAPLAADALVMFRPGVSEAQVRALLRARQAGVVAGPTETGAWLLRVDPAGLAALRASPEVQLAEPLQAGGAR